MSDKGLLNQCVEARASKRVLANRIVKLRFLIHASHPYWGQIDEVEEDGDYEIIAATKKRRASNLDAMSRRLTGSVREAFLRSGCVGTLEGRRRSWVTVQQKKKNFKHVVLFSRFLVDSIDVQVHVVSAKVG